MTLSGSGYRTSDLYFAALLRTASCEMIRHEKEGNKILFVFEDNPRIDDLQRDWINRKAKVDALTFTENIKSLKAICHMDPRRGGQKWKK